MTARSFEPDDRNTVVAPNGARVHRDHLAQSEVLRKNFYEVCPAVWCFVGNGLSVVRLKTSGGHGAPTCFL